MKEKLLISACLLGTPCRYDGKSKKDTRVVALQERFDLIPICPEVLGGLETPRLPCEIQGDKVIRRDGKDKTGAYLLGAERALAIARENGCSAAVLKNKSPSCGKIRYDGTFSKTLINLPGITAKLFIAEGIPVFSEEEIDLLIKEEAR